jgi:hypothetical protein
MKRSVFAPSAVDTSTTSGDNDVTIAAFAEPATAAAAATPTIEEMKVLLRI